MDNLVIPQVIGDNLLQQQQEYPTSSNIAANQAMEETALIGDGMFDERYNAYSKQVGGTVLDRSLERVLELNRDSKVREILENDEFTTEQKVEAVRFAADEISYKSLTAYDELMFQALRQDGGGMISADKFQRLYEETPASALRELSDITRNRQLTKMRRDVNSVAAANGFDTVTDAVTQIGMQDFIPIFNVATRIGFNQFMAEAAGVELGKFEQFLPGSTRARMREAFVAMEPPEFEEAVRDMVTEVERLKSHPVYGKMLTDYNILEHWMTVFGEGVLSQQNSVDNVDTFIGNLDVALESLFSIGLIMKLGGRTIRSTLHSADAAKTTQRAVTVRNGEAVTKINAAIQDEALNVKLELQSGEASAPLMPKPVTFLDDVEYAPDGVRQIVAQNERLRGELLATSINRGDSLLNDADINAVVRAELAELDEFDGAVVHSRMSTVHAYEDGSGIEINAIFGATPTKGWTDFEDVLIEALDLDPFLRQLDIMYVDDMGVLKKLDIDSAEFKQMVVDGDISLSRTGEILGAEEFFLRYRQERLWHPFDFHFYDDVETLSQSWGRFAFTPNAKFSEKFYGTFAGSALDEQRTVSILQQMSAPYHQLSVSDRRIADAMFEWGEDFGRVQGRNATYNEMIVAHPQATPAAIEGVIAMRNTMDTMYDMLNQRLYREFKSNGFQTARPIDPSLPDFHGKVAVRADDVQPGVALDPVSGELVNLTRRQINEIYEEGGSIMTDLPIAVAGRAGAKNKTTRVILEPGKYRAGELKTRPLKYHAGYTMRFYDDPYYVIKRDPNAKVDGRADPIGGSQAVRVAGTFDEGNRWATRANRAMNRRYGDDAPTFEVIRASDLDQGDSALHQKQVLQQEGRLFYDDRNYEVLPSTTGTRAELEDPAIALERGIHLAARQAAQEDPIRAVKEAWSREYGDLVKEGQLNRPGVDLRIVEDELTTQLRNAPSPEARTRIKDAREYVRYMRLMEGTGSKPVTFTRATLVAAGQALHRLFGMGDKRNRFFRWWDKRAGEAEPLRLMRSTAFTLFMRLRPIRQFVMQSAQIGFLAGIDPTYIMSGRALWDAQFLQAARSSFREGTEISEKAIAKAMGLNVNELRILAKQYDRSGLIDTVDVHSYTGQNTVHSRAQKLPSGSPLSGASYHGKKAGSMISNTLGEGFVRGESNNVSATYMVALRRRMKRNKVDSLSELNQDDWNAIRIDASNLALAMIKPNNMRYQTGALSVATQFLSFTHKATLALLGKNPAVSAKQAVALWMSGGLLYGAEFAGMSTFVGAMLAENQLDHVADAEVPGTNDTFQNLLKYGMLETSINAIGSMTAKEWQDLDLSFVSPGPDIKGLYEMQLMTIISDPYAAAFGPMASIGERTWKSVDYVHRVVSGTEMPAKDKAALVMLNIARNTVPIVNDFYNSWRASVLDTWINSKGVPLDIEPEFNSLMARGALGVRSRAELSRYEIEGALFENKETRDQIVTGYKSFFQQLFTDYYDRRITADVMQQQIDMVANEIDEWPDGAKANMVERIFIEDVEDGVPSIISRIADEMKNGTFDERILDAIDEMGLPEHEVALMKEMYRDAYGRRTTGIESELKERIQD